MALMIWSSGRRVANTPKVCTNGMWPLRASAPATPIMLASAMPAWMNRSGISAWNRSTSHWRGRSPLRHTISGRWRARFTSAWPYGLTTVAYGASSGGSSIMAGHLAGELVNRPCRESRGQLDEMAVGARGQAAQPVGGRGPAHQGLWPAGRRRPGQRGRHRVHVVAIEISGFPAERAPFADDRLDRGDAVDRPIDLGVVGIHEDGQPGQPVVAGEHRRLPQLTLLLLAVADEGEGPDVGPAREAVGQREAGRCGQPLAQRAAGVVEHGGALGPNGLHRRPVLPVGREAGLVDQAQFRGGGVGGD